MNLKIYTLDSTWAGLIVVVATSREAARECMKRNRAYNYSRDVIDKEIEEYEIVDGFFYENRGDS